jgi:dimethylhistidine N-methyltransferase
MDGRAPAISIVESTATSLSTYRQEILTGLKSPQKRLAPKYLYDERGSELFDKICSLPEYYATRTEIALLRGNGPEIAALVGPHAAIVELGAGSSVKARLLLGCLERPAHYLPVDISAAYLAEQAAAVAEAYPGVAVHPVFADFTQPFALPVSIAPSRTLAFFPGSTIGNLSRVRAAALLASLAQRMRGGGLLIGVDICKDPSVLHAAYNDPHDVTAAFNLNLLARMNRELDANFRLEAFEHHAVYDAPQSRIEMRLISLRDQTVTVSGVPIAFREGEYIVSEHSHKYEPEEFAELARTAGWTLQRRWIDDHARFSVQYFRAE